MTFEEYKNMAHLLRQLNFGKVDDLTLQRVIDGLPYDEIKAMFSNHSREDLLEQLEYHTKRENFNICAAIRDCISDKKK